MKTSIKHLHVRTYKCFAAILLILALPDQTLAAESFPFPGRAENLPPGHYWWLQKEHAPGIQGQGYDLGAGVRFDAAKQKWVGTNPKASGDSCATAPSNSDCIIYGQPAYAIADGEVLSCWRNAPENPAPGQKRDDIGDWDDPAIGKGVPSGGNLLKVDQGNGQVVLYAHFRPGSVPKSLCPIEDEFQTPAQTGVLPAGNRPKVKKGQKIGEVGNSGASSRPHLHIHMVKSTSGKVDEALPLRFHAAWIKSTAKQEDSPVDWVRLKGEALPNPPVATLPDYSKGLPEIARHGALRRFSPSIISRDPARLEWIDGFNVKGKIHFNVIFARTMALRGRLFIT